MLDEHGPVLDHVMFLLLPLLLGSPAIVRILCLFLVVFGTAMAILMYCRFVLMPLFKLHSE